MNKYQEALNDFSKTSKIVNGKVLIISNEYDASKFILYENQIRTLQELVDKATPKKVIGKGSDYVACPKCFIHLSYDKKTELGNDYCDTCGQAIDWSEDER